ncbi:hypothetical protein ONS95_011315 [Cadophora gregata]|uniref:uncharacterized protein n=1 Tax=Cadophora gregata TaxID=51156 RepID=UPI0026DCFF7B|nr:uncharacterized protein ONS95_011315 [Cadophora gregata]KAK0119885.1 hypothetical protein ONS95_011315 [Cadophora gregata]KAK0120922.1 hypothetical protein ONS96_011119 [Cadophora gregata f. sp. sojae]
MSAETMAAPAPQAAPVGLNSPPDSNSALKDGGSDSELSDLEPDVDMTEILEVEPDHISSGGVPVFKPTMDEFADFTRYMAAINKYGMRSGIVKVIPPPEWVAAQPRLDEAIKTVRVKEPIKQDIMGTGGTYRQANIVHQRSYNLPQWRQLCEQSEHQPPAKRGERRVNQDKPPKPSPKPKASTGGAKKKGAGRPPKNKSRSGNVDNDGTSTPDRLPTPVSPIMKAEDDNDSVKLEQEEYDTPMRRMGGRQPKAISVSSRRKNNKRETGVVDEAAFKDFKYELEGEDYSQERCDELERNYWKTLTYAPPLYGADMPGTLFDERTTTWNLGKLDNILDVLGSKIPGVNTAYLYLGMWKATFAWHLEDVDLYSINYLHFGAPKQWYSISQGDARRFEAAMKSIWPTDAKACDQFLRHKTFLISPSQLMSSYNIKVNKIVHHPGEFVITFPYGYHSGYNLGYNCAEAVNFGLESWLEYGRVAKKCECSEAQDSVWIDVHEIDRKLRGEETEYEETDDEEEEEDEEEDAKAANLPTPPESNGSTKLKIPNKKRKRPTTDKAGNPNSTVKRIRVRIKAPTREPCILCPNDIPSEPLLFTEDGQKAHRMCALYIPETSIMSGEKDTIVDVQYIDKARLDLKCNYCRSKKGACFQCSQKKCTRAYHATCAAAAGVLVEQGEIPVFGEDGTEYKDWGIDFSCRFHRSKRDKKMDGDTLGEDKRLLKAGLDLKPGDVCQMQYFKGDIFAGAVVENRISEEMILVDILPRGDRVEVEYKWLLVPDPADRRLQKPSAKAIPMPKSFKDKESLNTSKRQADDLPRADDPFVEGSTWAEFKSEKIQRNPAQVKVDFSKENQIWFYLGKNSTEAKAQFTEDPANPRHNPKGHFLDTIPKPAPVAARQSYSATYPSNLNPNASSISKTAPIRPPQPVANSVRSEKPYVYKPRSSGEMYSIDPKAYVDQQKFLQRSVPAPYAFGTDPRYRQADPPRASGQFTVSNPPAASMSSDIRLSPHMATARPAPSLATSRPPAAVPRPANAMAPPRVGASMPASYPSYRPPQPPAPRPMNPFGSRPPSSSSRPNPFAKYSYLQKEHNRSPLEYKSPYRPGGGFMNGYQGSLQAHLQQTMFRQNTGRVSTPLSSISTLGSSLKTQSNSQSPVSSYSTESPTAYNSHRSSGTPAPAPVHNQNWATAPPKKDSSQLHPAIRQEYNSMVRHEYPPTTQNSQSSHYQGSVLQPPAMYDRTATQLQAPYQPFSTPQQARYYSQQQSHNPYHNTQPLQQNVAASQASPFINSHHPGVALPSARPAISHPHYHSHSSPVMRSTSAQQPVSQQQRPPADVVRKSPDQPFVAQQQHQTPRPVDKKSPEQLASPQQQLQPNSAAGKSPDHAAVTQQQFQPHSVAVKSPDHAVTSQRQIQTPSLATESPGQTPLPQQYSTASTIAPSLNQPPVSQQPHQPHYATTGPGPQVLPSHQQHQNFPRVPPQEGKILYPHQQYFQPPTIHSQGSEAGLMPTDQNLQLRAFPDVPADSTTLVERMMMTLKRAPAA